MKHAYAGRLRGHLERNGLELAETSYRIGQRIRGHVHERPMLVLVNRGAMIELVRGRAVDCPAGTVLFHPAGESHAHRFEAPAAQCLVLQLDDSWFRRLQVERKAIPAGPTTGSGEGVTGTARLLHAEFRLGRDAASAALDGLALALLASLARRRERRPDTRPSFLRPVLERLHDDPGSDVDLASLAEVAGVTPEHLARTFRRKEGCTVGEYLRRVRVARARRALAEGELPLSRLALELGFYDQSHFTRTFKAQVGCTPGAYRRRRRGRYTEPGSRGGGHGGEVRE